MKTYTVTQEQVDRVRDRIRELNRLHLEYSAESMRAANENDDERARGFAHTSQAFMWQQTGCQDALSMLGLLHTAPASAYSQPSMLADDAGAPLFSMGG